MVIVLSAGVGVDFRIIGSETVARCITVVELGSFF